MEAKTNEEFFNVSALIDERFGKEGTVTRAEAEEKAYAFYTGQIIEDARKKAKITQAELARRIGSDRSYISRVESGQTEPKVSTFYRKFLTFVFFLEENRRIEIRNIKMKSCKSTLTNPHLFACEGDEILFI